jgi:anti-sigma factor RsiW
MKEDDLSSPAEADLHAWVDGRLDPARSAEFEARLAADPALAAQARAWSAQRDALRGLHAQVLDDPVPAHLLGAAQQLHHRSNRFAQWQRWGGVAASVLVAFAVGWASRVQWESHVAGAGAAARGTMAFAHQAAAAYAVYVPEVRHPVEVDATQQQHLVQWLSKRLNRPLKVPNLAGAGYELVGGRLLPGDNGARAQFMYQNTNGERVTLYVGAIDAASAKGMNETAFRYTTEGGVSSFYWVDQGFGYALSGKLPRATLLGLAESVYKQL